jgi:hypothetical protein
MKSLKDHYTTPLGGVVGANAGRPGETRKPPKPIGTAACLAVRPSSTGAPVFVRAQTARAASQVRQKRRGPQRHTDLIEQQDDGAHHEATIAALDPIAEIEERSR